MQIYMYIIIINIVEETLTQKNMKKLHSITYTCMYYTLQVKIEFRLKFFTYCIYSTIS